MKKHFLKSGVAYLGDNGWMTGDVPLHHGQENTAPVRKQPSRHGEVRIAIVGMENDTAVCAVGVEERRFGDCLKFAGGGIEEGETALAAATREVEQETGLHLAPENFELLSEERKKKWLGGGTFVEHPLHFFLVVIQASRISAEVLRVTDDTNVYVLEFDTFLEEPRFFKKHLDLRKRLDEEFND